MMPPLPRRALLAAGAAGVLARRAVAEEPGLAALAAARGIAFGSMACEYHLRETPALWPLLRREAGFIVPGLELKWAASEPEPGRFAFTDAEALLARARRPAWRPMAMPWSGTRPCRRGSTPGWMPLACARCCGGISPAWRATSPASWRSGTW
ncbi:endo-1,4-beta-xylanase [Pseudoroseomonas wenyumeiae]